MIRAVVIHPDGHVAPVALYETEDLYTQLKNIIGGWVTEWKSPWPNLSFFCDEDGLLKKLPFNHLCTSLLDQGLSSAPAVGTFVVAGRTNPRTGEPKSLTVEQANIFLSAEGEDILNALAGD